MILAYASDKARQRLIFVLFPLLVCIAGFAMLLAIHDKTHVQYAALFLVASGAYSAMPVIVCWFNMNLGGHHRRAVGTAFQVGFGNTGGIVAVYAFLKKDAPRYKTGYSICIAFVCLSLVSSIIYFVLCKIQNRNRDRAVADRGLTDHERTELGDMSPDYRYML
jgi:hypothetical protein